jgi:hypothetical protein
LHSKKKGRNFAALIKDEYRDIRRTRRKVLKEVSFVDASRLTLEAF